MTSTTASSLARSCPSDCALSGSFQTSGLSSSRSISVSCSDLLSKSKIPPQRLYTAFHFFELIV
ncbi:MAG TPA: hypothetical protein ENG90_03020 [Gammaproteobacteria bacterium]|nr:hypothetical protein [Gammaproteobacteria bacterium]